MFPDDLCRIMTEAQKKAYGDGLAEETLHPYMWVCKGHYYSAGLKIIVSFIFLFTVMAFSHF